MQVLLPRSGPAFFCAVLLAGAALAACGRRAGAPTPSAEAEPSSDTGGYVAPPAVDRADRDAQGMTLAGRAPAGAQVTLASPTASPMSVRADAQGRWSVHLSAAAAPALFALSAQQGDRLVRGEGALVVLPPPGPAALLARAGFAALPIGTAPPVLSIVAIDFDAGGGAAVAGFARPMAGVRLSFDGAAAGVGQADETGRFGVVAANRPLAPGRRRIEVESEGVRSAVVTPVSRPVGLGGQAYRAARQYGGWRIDWAPAGGGVQTTVVFDHPATGSLAPAQPAGAKP